MYTKSKIIYPEIWGGIECTVNRLNDKYVDQLELSKHSSRLSDLELITSLGIKTIRYPLLWEKNCKGKPGEYNWEWCDERYSKLRALNTTIIAGLLHHGSGPRFTNLIDINFPELFAQYARDAANRYPWVTYYTPINEPLTTARFSCLYGHWYPHLQSDAAFSRALINQCKAIVLAMKAIRSVNPEAKLVQTEDLGKTFSTKRLKYQADFENERRWLTYDLLCGKINSDSRFWNFFTGTGIKEDELYFFIENALPPDIIGINYYVTSERHLDHRTNKYPHLKPGKNAYCSYIDTEAVRVREFAGISKLLKEAWKRYHLPLAVTEAHISCTREEQLRWFKYIYESVVDLNKKGSNIKAVTAWALLGAYDWNTLITMPAGHYESGTFDLRSKTPRKTALAFYIRSLNGLQEYNHPVLAQPGWWKRSDRFINQKFRVCGNSDANPVLITGKTGTLGNAFSLICRRRGISFVILSRAEMDIANPNSVCAVIEKYKPWAIINTAGYVKVDRAESEIEFCIRENTTGPKVLADACSKYGIKLLTFSTDLVFDGRIKDPYTESIPVRPINIYGKSKADAEKYITRNNPSALIIRSSAFFGPWDEYNFLTQSVRSLSCGKNLLVPDDIKVSPTYVPDLVDAALDLFIDDEKGIWHLTNNYALTWYDFLVSAADMLGIEKKKIIGVSSTEMNYIAPRPFNSALSSERGIILPGLDNALGRYSRDIRN